MADGNHKGFMSPAPLPAPRVRRRGWRVAAGPPHEGDATSAGRMNMHMDMHMNEMTGVEQPESKRRRVRVRGGRDLHTCRRNDD
eukprot:6524680-Prymnesium_polylepis.1